MIEVPGRDYQIALADGISAEWKQGNDKVVMVLSTGGGKTRTAIILCQRAIKKGRRVLFMAHRRRLIQQIAETAAQFKIPYGVVMADLPADERNSHWVKYNPTAPIQIASRDTLIARAVKSERQGIPKSDLLIVDEVHNLSSQGYLDLANACNVKHWVGLTATPCRPDGSGLSRMVWDSMVIGPSIKKLVEMNAVDPTTGLVPSTVYYPEKLGQKRMKGEKTKLAGDPVGHWKRLAKDLPTVVFCSTVAEATAVRDDYRRAGITAECMHAKTLQEERDDIFDLVTSGKVKVVTNAFICTEGVDVPKWACCQLLRRCESLIQYLQCVGRVLRPFPGKEKAIILDHTAAHVKHGLPDAERDWALGEGYNVDRKRQQDRDDGKITPAMVCLNCGAAFDGGFFCPACGVPVRRKEKKVDPEVVAEMLVESKGIGPIFDAAQAEWKRLLFAGAAKKMKCCQVVAIFKTKYGNYPHQVGVGPHLPYDDRNLTVGEVLPDYLPKKKGTS